MKNQIEYRNYFYSYKSLRLLHLWETSILRNISIFCFTYYFKHSIAIVIQNISSWVSRIFVFSQFIFSYWDINISWYNNFIYINRTISIKENIINLIEGKLPSTKNFGLLVDIGNNISLVSDSIILLSI